MRKTIQNLRSKPEGTRKAIALFSSGAITLMIFFVWVTTFSFRQEHGSIISRIDFKTPVQAMTSSTASVFDSLRNKVSGVEKKVGEINNKYESKMVNTYTVNE
jgi:hypothetical protein